VRVALVSPYDLDVVGGVQSHVTALAAALRALGDDVLVVGPGGHDGPDGADGSDRSARDGAGTVRVGGSVRVPANGSRAPVALAPRAVTRTRAALAGFRPDVVQVHEPAVPVVGPAAVLGTSAPIVLTFHAAAEGGTLPRLARLARPVGRALVRRAAALTAVSAEAAAFHARALGLDPDRFTIVPNGVDAARFGAHRQAPGAGADGPTLLFVGRLEPRKGADLALEAFARLASDRPALRLRVVGAGPAGRALAGRVADLPPDVAARVELLGAVTQADLPRIMAAADVALVPSRGGESFGIILLELMAAGTAIVASDLAGYRAVARSGREAVLVPPGDAAALAAAAARLLDDRAAAAALVAAGRDRSEEYAWPRVAARVRAILAAAAAGPSRSDGRSRAEAGP
jgi:phosphatidylinositol alpha-mannosyltransferase